MTVPSARTDAANAGASAAGSAASADTPPPLAAAPPPAAATSTVPFESSSNIPFDVSTLPQSKAASHHQNRDRPHSSRAAASAVDCLNFQQQFLVLSAQAGVLANAVTKTHQFAQNEHHLQQSTQPSSNKLQAQLRRQLDLLLEQQQQHAQQLFMLNQRHQDQMQELQPQLSLPQNQQYQRQYLMYKHMVDALFQRLRQSGILPLPSFGTQQQQQSMTFQQLLERIQQASPALAHLQQPGVNAPPVVGGGAANAPLNAAATNVPFNAAATVAPFNAAATNVPFYATATVQAGGMGGGAPDLTATAGPTQQAHDPQMMHHNLFRQFCMGIQQQQMQQFHLQQQQQQQQFQQQQQQQQQHQLHQHFQQQQQQQQQLLMYQQQQMMQQQRQQQQQQYGLPTMPLPPLPSMMPTLPPAPAPSSANQGSLRSPSLQESIHLNIENQQKELNDQIKLQEKQTLELQNRQQQQVKGEQQTLHAQNQRQSQKLRQTEHLEQLQQLFAQQRSLKPPTAASDLQLQQADGAPLPHGPKSTNASAAGAFVSSRKSQGGIAKSRA